MPGKNTNDQSIKLLVTGKSTFAFSKCTNQLSCKRMNMASRKSITQEESTPEIKKNSIKFGRFSRKPWAKYHQLSGRTLERSLRVSWATEAKQQQPNGHRKGWRWVKMDAVFWRLRKHAFYTIFLDEDPFLHYCF